MDSMDDVDDMDSPSSMQSMPSMQSMCLVPSWNLPGTFLEPSWTRPLIG
jgi:hypothetical protein